MEVKMEDEPEAAGNTEQESQRTEHQDGAVQGEQIKVEADKAGNNSRKRPHEESRGYNYYEHREEKRYAHTNTMLLNQQLTGVGGNVVVESVR